MPDFKTQPVSDQPLPPTPPTPAAPTAPAVSRWANIKQFYRNNKWYVWAISLGVVIIAVLSFFAFRTQKIAPTQQAKVIVSIDSPDTATSGGEIIYKIQINNQDTSALVKNELELVYPNGVTYVSSTPQAENLSGTLFKVPDLTPGQNAVVIIKASATGNINDDKQLLARLHYYFNNFNSEFIKEATKTVRISASDVALDMTGTQSTTNAQIVSYDVAYANNSGHDIASARIEVVYPDGFSYADSTPKPDLAKNIWNLGTLKAGQSGKINFQGTFKAAQPGQGQTFTANLVVPDNQGNFNTQASTTFSTTISALPLLVTQVLDNSSGTVANPGDTLRFTLTYQNTAATTASGVNIVETLDDKSLDLNTLQAQGGQINNNTITWDASGVPNLEHLNPNDQGTLHFTVKVKNPAVSDSSKNISIKASVKIKANEYSTFLPGNDLTVKVSSPSSLDGSAKFVSGQLPLKVGKASTFQVVLTLTDSTDDFDAGSLTGFVPTGVQFSAASLPSKEAAKVTFDSSTGKLVWNVGLLSAHSGDFNPPRILTFNVTVNPGNSQVGQEMTLFKTINFSAKDNFTAQDISLQTADVKTTDIPNGFSDGRVQP